MTTKFYVDSSGNYLGGFDGAPPQQGAIQVPAAPGHALQKWDGRQFLPLDPGLVAVADLTAADLAASLVAKGVLGVDDLPATARAQISDAVAARAEP